MLRTVSALRKTCGIKADRRVLDSCDTAGNLGNVPLAGRQPCAEQAELYAKAGASASAKFLSGLGKRAAGRNGRFAGRPGGRCPAPWVPRPRGTDRPARCAGGGHAGHRRKVKPALTNKGAPEPRSLRTRPPLAPIRPALADLRQPVPEGSMDSRPTTARARHSRRLAHSTCMPSPTAMHDRARTGRKGRSRASVERPAQHHRSLGSRPWTTAA